MLDLVEKHIGELEVRIRQTVGKLGWVRLLKSLPGVGEILGATIYLEIGDVNRFPTPGHLASYAGLTPRVSASGGRIWLGRTSPQANHYLRWAFVEAADAILLHRAKYTGAHALELYDRLKRHKCHGKAAVAVARHLAEASWWILTKKQSYRPPRAHAVAVSSSRNG